MSTTAESLIHLKSVKKVFVTDEVETHALENIQLDIKKGEYVAISGPSGCGKSTLLAILGLLDTPTERAQVVAERVRESIVSSQGLGTPPHMSIVVAGRSAGSTATESLLGEAQARAAIDDHLAEPPSMGPH